MGLLSNSRKRNRKLYYYRLTIGLMVLLSGYYHKISVQTIFVHASLYPTKLCPDYYRITTYIGYYRIAVISQYYYRITINYYES